jgi:hypothetical protein
MKKRIVTTKWYVFFELNPLWGELLSSRESWIFNTRLSTPFLVTLSCHQNISHSDILSGCGCFPTRIALSSTLNFYHDYNLFTFFVSILNVSIPCSIHLWNTCKTLPLVITFHWHQQKDMSNKKRQTFWNHLPLFFFFNYPNPHQYNVCDLTLWIIHLLTRLTSFNCCLFNILQPP